MARGRGQDRRPPGAPPVEMVAGAADLSKMRANDAGEFGPVLPYGVNDVQPTVETDGTLTLHFRYLGQGQASDPVSINLPAGLFAELCTLAPQLLTEAAKRCFMQGDRLSKVVLASGVEDPDLERLMKLREPDRPGTVSSLEDHRG